MEEAKETADDTIKNINKIASGAGLGSALEKERDTLRTSIKSLEKPKKERQVQDMVRLLKNSVQGIESP